MIVAFVVIAAIAVAVLEWYSIQKGLDGLEVDQRVSPAAVEQGETFDAVLSFSNHGRRVVPFLRFRESLPDGMTVCAASDSPCQKTDWGGRSMVTGSVWLMPHQRLERRIPAAVDQRGLYYLRGLSIVGGDFLGLQETVHTVERFCEIVAYPKEADIPKLDEVLGGFIGALSVRRFLFEDPILTLGFREYTGREPMKQISWSQSSRNGKLMVKNFDYTTEPSVSVLLNIDCNEDDPEARIEQCLSLARSVCRQLEDNGIQYEFRMNALMAGSMASQCYIPDGLGRTHFYSILECLGRATYNAAYSSQKLMEKAFDNRTVSQGIILITADESPEMANFAKSAAARRNVPLLRLTAGEHVG